MTPSDLNGIALVASIASTILSLWQIAKGTGTPLRRWGSFSASILLLFAAGLGLSKFYGRSASSVSATEAANRPPSSGTQPTGTTSSAAANAPPSLPRIPSEQPSKPRIEPDETARYIDSTMADPANGVAVAIVDDHGERQPQLIDAANQALAAKGLHPVAVLRDAAIAARLPQQIVAGSTDFMRQIHLAAVCRQILAGTVKRTSEKETEGALQGLITTRLHLRLRLIECESGAILRSFETDERGGGFTESIVEAQAIERAATTIRFELTRPTH